MQTANAPLEQAVTMSHSPEDRVTDIKTLYNISGWSIVWRNFLAGFSRALGGVFIYLIFAAISYVIFMNTVWPQIEPFVVGYTNLMNTLSTSPEPSPNKSNTNSGFQIPLQDIQNDPLFQQLIKKYQ